MKVILVTTEGAPGRKVAKQLLAAGYCQAIFVDQMRRTVTKTTWQKIKGHLDKGGLLELMHLAGNLIFRRGNLAKDAGQEVPSWEVVASEFRVPLHRVDSINSVQTQELLRGYEPDLGVIYGGRILKKAVLAIPKLGFLNKHSSLLPRHRGPQAEFWILYHEDFDSLGVSIHFAEETVDAGPILLQEKMSFCAGDTPERLREKSHELGARLLVRAIEGFVKKDLIPKRQEGANATTNGVPSLGQKSALRRKLPRLWSVYGSKS